MHAGNNTEQGMAW